MITDRQLVARVYRGKLDKPARDLSPAYVRRLARGIRAARAAGEAPIRQVARGHRPRVVGGVTVTTEHPKEYVRRGGKRFYGAAIEGVKPSPIRKGATDRHVAGHAILTERDFVTLYPAWRWAVGHPPETGIQAIGYGVLRPEYVEKVKSGTPPEEHEDEDDEPDESEPDWRPFYTGNARGDVDYNGAKFDTYAHARAARDLVFEPGTVEAYLIRRQA